MPNNKTEKPTIYRLGFEFKTSKGMNQFFEAMKSVGEPFNQCAIISTKELKGSLYEKCSVKEYLVKNMSIEHPLDTNDLTIFEEDTNE